MLGFHTRCCMLWHWHPKAIINWLYQDASKLCIIILSIPDANITWSDLIMIKPWLGNQSISGFIALNPIPTCDNFANLLLQNRLVVKNLRSESSSNDTFVTAVLDQWCSRAGTPVPFTWRDLTQCMKDAGLDPRTVQVIEQHVLWQCHASKDCDSNSNFFHVEHFSW